MTTMAMTWSEMRALPITAEDIERVRAAGACADEWADAEPRAWGDAPPEWVGWYGASAATPEQLDACIAGTDAEGRGLIGTTRRDLTPAQLDACISGTDAEGRLCIGVERRDLTPEQLSACIAGTDAWGRWWIGVCRRDLTPEQRTACGASRRRVVEAVWDDQRSTAGSAAVIIRSAYDGRCSGEPAGVRYPGVPTVDEVMDQAGVRHGDTTSEADWLRLCDAVCDV